MQYLIIIISVLISSLVLLVVYMKKVTKNNNFILPNTKSNEITKNDIYSDNPNPSFEVTLMDYKENQLAINKSFENESVSFKVAKNKRINVYTTNKKYIGQIAIKDYKQFNLIAQKPQYFEGIIIGYQTINMITKKVIISVEAKQENSIEIYKIDKSYLNTLITLKAMFEKNEIIETNYGPSTIIEVFENHLLVDVPSLGNREIYDIEHILNSNK